MSGIGSIIGGISSLAGGGSSGSDFVNQMQQLQQEQQQSEVQQAQYSTENSITTGWANAFQTVQKEQSDLAQALMSADASTSKEASSATQNA